MSLKKKKKKMDMISEGMTNYPDKATHPLTGRRARDDA